MINHCIMASVFFLLSMKVYAQKNSVMIDWNKTVMVSKTTPTLQLVENPMVRPSSPIHKKVFEALQNLNANFVRYVPWCPYPRLAVAELKRPTKTATFWDFTYLDSTMEAFMKATSGHSVVVNFSTTPSWMWNINYDVPYPQDPYKVFWSYNDGNVLRDTTMMELAGYYARLFSWYTKGGFTDELGKFHKSDHFYKIPYWEVLNEPDLEHNIPVEMYTKMYDAIVGELKKISPDTKFIGISLAFNGRPEYFEYFLDPKNHKPGIPLDGISYHFYGTPSYDMQTLEDFQYTFFEKADAFLEKVKFIESIRKRLSPHTITTVNEIGNIINAQTGNDIPKDYWNLSGAMYAYIFLQLTIQGIDVAGESQLVGYPTQFPDVTMLNWTNGNPNPRYWVLKLLLDNFGKGDTLATTSFHGSGVSCQAFSTPKGKKLLLINHNNKEVAISLPIGIKGATADYGDTSIGENPPAHIRLTEESITLQPFSVAVVQL